MLWGPISFVLIGCTLVGAFVLYRYVQGRADMPGRGLDERERQLRDRAWILSYQVLAAVVVLLVAALVLPVLGFGQPVDDRRVDRDRGGPLPRRPAPPAPGRRARVARAGSPRGRVMPRAADRTEPVLHNRLAVLRAERGLSRQELADGLGVNYQTIGYLERGEYNPSLDLALRAPPSSSACRSRRSSAATRSRRCRRSWYGNC